MISRARNGEVRVEEPVDPGAATPSRAVAPVETGRVEVRGVGIAYEIFGAGERTLLLLPPWSITHSRFWKSQVPYLARHFRVVTFDPVGNGRSDRPTSAEAYTLDLEREHTLALLEHAHVERAVMVAHCAAAPLGLLLAANHADRVAGAVFMSPALPLTPPLPERTGFDFEAELPVYEGWAKKNRNYWRHDFRGYLDFFFARCLTEPHSTKQIEDCIGWALEGSPETLALTIDGPGLDADTMDHLLGRLQCPLLVMQGDEDALIPPDRGAAFAEMTGAELVELKDVGHCPHARYPVHFNVLLRDFAERCFGSSPPDRASSQMSTAAAARPV